MWSFMAVRRSEAPSVPTQEGSWECQTRVWPRTSMPRLCAWSTIRSAEVKVKVPRLGSVASHFISFSGVTEPNSRSSVAV